MVLRAAHIFSINNLRADITQEITTRTRCTFLSRQVSICSAGTVMANDH